MPPLLHPRSTATSTLFAGTLLASFVVISIPHVFPCSRPRQQYLDAEGKLQTTPGGKPIAAQGQQSAQERKGRDQDDAAILKMLQDEARQLEEQERHARECPVPKPRGWIGKVLGFEATKAPATAEEKQATKT